jgi:hypothetical protein
MRWLWVLLTVFLQQTLDLPSDWGDLQAFGVAEQRDAPLLVIGDNWTIGVWMSADEHDTYHTLRRSDQSGLGEENRLSILTAFPQKHHTVPARSGQHHLLWLDGEPSQPLGGLRLWSVLIDQTPDAVQGAFILNDYPIYDYDAVSDGAGGAWIFFTSLPMSEPNLYAQYLDSQGRYRPIEYIGSTAQHPRAVRLEDGTIRLFWHNPLTGKLMTGIFDSEQAQLADITALIAYPRLGKTDLFEQVQVAVDQTTFYIFWTINHIAQDAIVTLFSSAPRSNIHQWTPAQVLAVEARQATWIAPAGGLSIHDYLSVGVVLDNEIGIISMQDGAVRDYQNVLGLGESRLIGRLRSAITADGRLALSWSHLSPTGAVMSVIRQP